jgi:hypothetical protein
MAVASAFGTIQEARMCIATSHEVLTLELASLTREIEAGLLAFASVEARDEWARFRHRWSSSRADTRDDSFEMAVQRLRRFRTILNGKRELYVVSVGA